MKQELKVETQQEKLLKLRIQWYGYVLCMDNKRIPLTVPKMKMVNKEPLGELGGIFKTEKVYSLCVWLYTNVQKCVSAHMYSHYVEYLIYKIFTYITF
jgi:hypothetical protein